MRYYGLTFCILASFAPAALSGCTGYPKPPQFSVTSFAGRPSVLSIVNEIKCELSDIVSGQDELTKKPYAFAGELLRANYGFAAELDLEIEDSGALAPSFTFSPTTEFAIDAGLKYSRARTTTFTTEIVLDLNDIKNAPPDCPLRQVGKYQNNLDYDLGLRNIVRLGMSNSNPQKDEDAAKGGEFGGSVSFVVVQGFDATGPTWTLKHFEGPGKLASYTRQKTDKVTFGFAIVKDDEGAEAKGKKAAAASAYVRYLTTKDIGSDIQDIKSQLSR
jgi:hypothetical protein